MIAQHNGVDDGLKVLSLFSCFLPISRCAPPAARATIFHRRNQREASPEVRLFVGPGACLRHIGGGGAHELQGSATSHASARGALPPSQDDTLSTILIFLRRLQPPL